jgi:hypothetical protein
MTQKITSYEQAQELLRLPFLPEEIDTHVVDNRVLLHVDARAVRRRLNEVVGHNWQTKMFPVTPGGMICELEVLGVVRADAAGESNFAGVKGAASGALKRAAINHGIGEYLYEAGAHVRYGAGNYRAQYLNWLVNRGIDEFGWPLGWSAGNHPQEVQKLWELKTLKQAVKEQVANGVETKVISREQAAEQMKAVVGTVNLKEINADNLPQMRSFVDWLENRVGLVTT